LTRGLQANCEGNIELKQYNESNLVTVTRLLTHSGCIWQEDFNSLNHSQELHVRNKRAAGQAEEGTNPTITLLLNIAHAFHLTSVVILAIMVAEVENTHNICICVVDQLLSLFRCSTRLN